MNSEKNKKSLCVYAGILMAFSVLFLILKLAWTSKEYIAIQSVLENLPMYQGEIESWGYQVSVFDPMKDPFDDTEDVELLPHALLHYAEGVYAPVLILTDQTGGMWFFYNGFDQYAWETKNLELKTVGQDEKQMVDVVTKFWLQKDQLNKPPMEFNFAKRGKRAYYDVEITLYVSAVSPETGERVGIRNGGFYDTQYCSNNFEECSRFSGIDPTSVSYNTNREIKKQYTAEQLLDFYRQGLALQNRLMDLYQNRHE